MSNGESVITVSDTLVTALRHRLGNPLESEIANDQLILNIAEAAREFARYRGRLKIDKTQTTTANTQAYDVPDDYAAIYDVHWRLKGASELGEVGEELFHHPGLNTIHQLKDAHYIQDFDDWEVYYDEDESKEMLHLIPPPSVTGRELWIIFRETIADTETMGRRDQDIMLLHAEYLSRIQLLGSDAVVKVADVSEDKRAALDVAKNIEQKFRDKMKTAEAMRS